MKGASKVYFEIHTATLVPSRSNWNILRHLCNKQSKALVERSWPALM
ncbi:hypothetical protein SORBI_3009G025750 [Sorghum bicolor]|uniref:Uncharacterized protein n=1 Tax=Sorghum bicolor TaxID=4558 RepID=C5YZ32_SORBI|nr:hypothetical protein SORBI_3009G025750 [Sorghum bicolor]